VQRHEPGWIDRVTPYTSRGPGLTISIADISRRGVGVMSAAMVFEMDGHRFEQPFTAEERSDNELARLAHAVGCKVTKVLGARRNWLAFRPEQAEEDCPG